MNLIFVDTKAVRAVEYGATRAAAGRVVVVASQPGLVSKVALGVAAVSSKPGAALLPVGRVTVSLQRVATVKLPVATAMAIGITGARSITISIGAAMVAEAAPVPPDSNSNHPALRAPVDRHRRRPAPVAKP